MSLWCAWSKQPPSSRTHRTPPLTLTQCHMKADQVLKTAYSLWNWHSELARRSFFWGFVMGMSWGDVTVCAKPVQGNRLGKQWALWHALLPCTDHLPGKKANSPPVWSSSCYWRFGGVIGGSLLPIGTKSWVTPMLYAAQQSFGGRIWRLVRSCIHLS